jgi:hypothetical protein
VKTRGFFAALLILLAALHLCHAPVLWTEEDLPLAAARQILFGKTLYSRIWFDKPPLVPLVYLLWGARIGVVLRLFGALYIWACCVVAYLFGRDAFGRAAGFWAAGLLAFFLSFDTPSAVLPLAADLLLVLPHLAAVYLAYRKRALWSGICAGIGFLTNVKAALVLAACALFLWPSILPLAVGFSLPVIVAIAALIGTGAWSSYVDQVWTWPAIYAGSSHVADPLRNGLIRTLNWSGFHAALLGAAACAFWRNPRWRWAAWAGLAFVGAAMGARFFPRYFFLLLPPLVLLAAQGFAGMRMRWRLALALLLLIPLVRFGPRYIILALNHDSAWPDLAMDRDSYSAAQQIRAMAGPNDTLYVWGYRPDIFVYTGMRAASRYLDSQAMTGVPADRHLTQSTPVRVGTTAEARRELAGSQPDFIADGLSLYNPQLAMQSYPELREWLTHYQEFARTRNTILYRRVGRRANR